MKYDSNTNRLDRRIRRLKKRVGEFYTVVDRLFELSKKML